MTSPHGRSLRKLWIEDGRSVDQCACAFDHPAQSDQKGGRGPTAPGTGRVWPITKMDAPMTRPTSQHEDGEPRGLGEAVP